MVQGLQVLNRPDFIHLLKSGYLSIWLDNYVGWSLSISISLPMTV